VEIWASIRATSGSLQVRAPLVISSASTRPRSTSRATSPGLKYGLKAMPIKAEERDLRLGLPGDDACMDDAEDRRHQSLRRQGRRLPPVGHGPIRVRIPETVESAISSVSAISLPVRRSPPQPLRLDRLLAGAVRVRLGTEDRRAR
jgi:hypothetical protein